MLHCLTRAVAAVAASRPIACSSRWDGACRARDLGTAGQPVFSSAGRLPDENTTSSQTRWQTHSQQLQRDHRQTSSGTSSARKFRSSSIRASPTRVSRPCRTQLRTMYALDAGRRAAGTHGVVISLADLARVSISSSASYLSPSIAPQASSRAWMDT